MPDSEPASNPVEGDTESTTVLPDSAGVGASGGLGSGCVTVATAGKSGMNTGAARNTGTTS